MIYQSVPYSHPRYSSSRPLALPLEVDSYRDISIGKHIENPLLGVQLDVVRRIGLKVRKKIFRWEV